MSTASATPIKSPQSIRQLIAAHPVAAMLLLMFGIGWAFLFPAALAGIPLIPFPLLGAVFLAQLGSALFVTWAADGRSGVRGLLGRVFRWRVNPVWYAVALLLIPIVSLAWTAAVFGGGAIHALLTNRTVILDYLNALTILPIVSLWEEMAWMGVVQARLATYRGPLLAAVITGPLFGLLHMPLNLGKPVGPFLVSVTAQVLFAIPFRMLLGWIYNVTGGSILLVALTHLTFDAANNTNLVVAASPGQVILQPGGGAVWFVIAALGFGVLILTRGQLGAPRKIASEAPDAKPVSSAADPRLTDES